MAAAPTRSYPSLAGALDNQSNQLAELGRPEEALTAIEEAVVAYRALADDRPDVLARRYANSLETRDAILSALGREADGRRSPRNGAGAMRWLRSAPRARSRGVIVDDGLRVPKRDGVHCDQRSGGRGEHRIAQYAGLVVFAFPPLADRPQIRLSQLWHGSDTGIGRC